MATNTRKGSVNNNHTLVDAIRSEDCTLDGQVIIPVYTCEV